MTVVELVRLFAEPFDTAVLLTDVDLERPSPTVLYVNPAFTRMSGYAGSDVVEAPGTPLANHRSCLRRRDPARDVFAMVASARMRTVSDWTDEGYRGLRILKCTSCRTMTWRTWDQLQAHGAEEVLAVAQRFHCGKCDQVPAGLPIVVGTGR